MVQCYDSGSLLCYILILLPSGYIDRLLFQGAASIETMQTENRGLNNIITEYSNEKPWFSFPCIPSTYVSNSLSFTGFFSNAVKQGIVDRCKADCTYIIYIRIHLSIH